MTDDPPTEFDLMAFTPYRLAVVAQRLSELLARQYRDRFGISIPDWRVLVHLAHSGGASVRDIEARVAMEKSKVSRTCKRLETRGLIAKRAHDTDRRLVHLTLTDEGRQMMRDLLPLAAAFQGEVEARLGADFARLEQGIDGVLSRFDPAVTETD
ncbi:MarR family transcriptional regulator [Salipiger sp. IMCC34102]|uniref:MarR family winged helix-turn-helix transcriptional regulator n=1 Tax=Salipiger sp. IMCC34102 TaxID=2510647 RepID=UPI00101E077A|nr:MarR family winged helix-turn-helix transcriptional regulator [Salipiger sp. IMCC34102]RYH02661.1 MarR family transcriptional regulator [Salipiger sp. IMCC34102]